MLNTTTMDELIQSMSGGAHVSQDLQALQDYLNQNIHAPSLSSTSSFRALPPSRSTSTTRPPPIHIATHTHSHSHESYLPAVYATPLQTPLPVEESSYPSSYPARPPTLRRSSSYGFGIGSAGQSRAASPYTEFSAFEGDAFAPLIDQPQCSSGPSDPWARWKQQSAESASAWSAFGSQQHNHGQLQPKMAAFGGGMKQQNQFTGFGFGRYQSPQRAVERVGRPPTPPDEDDEMMGTEMELQDEDEDAVEREMGGGMEDEGMHIVRPESAPGDLGRMWRGQGFEACERGRRIM